ncbi:MAG: hypothetical protein GWO16_12360, partial [Gammaproteobacteria bacterium]|nr:hypothetical protein [Gammaproteobacteria bacterium]NIR98696.1 hypothetical protein [Gammaproteobacteria bacterium]NIT64411.1 hypothetical protein [Gammaproteobacteria bacterium]NIV21338.1 hypothetical protein [Gammaproteobacteria bacterium]NIY32991.1 hypothetical protein [Gammaproteobacteria bacterium]
TYHRNLNLNRRKLIPDAKLDESRAQRDQARFNLRLAEIELQKSQVVSPLTGVVKST